MTDKPKIPTREEFHRYWCGYIYPSDFCTDFPPIDGYNSSKIISSIIWTKQNQNRTVYRFS